MSGHHGKVSNKREWDRYKENPKGIVLAVLGLLPPVYRYHFDSLCMNPDVPDEAVATLVFL